MLIRTVKITVLLFLFSSILVVSPFSGVAPDLLSGTSFLSAPGSGNESTSPAACNTDKSSAGQMVTDHPFMDLPLLFTQNKGQVDSSVSYYVKADGQTIYFTEQGLIFDLMRTEAGEENALATELRILLGFVIVCRLSYTG